MKKGWGGDEVWGGGGWGRELGKRGGVRVMKREE